MDSPHQSPAVPDQTTQQSLAAEAATGACLLAGGPAILVAPDGQWSRLLSTFALGMLVYRLVQSPGYYVDRYDRAMLAMQSPD